MKRQALGNRSPIGKIQLTPDLKHAANELTMMKLYREHFKVTAENYGSGGFFFVQDADQDGTFSYYNLTSEDAPEFGEVKTEDLNQKAYTFSKLNQ